jgi:CheY-like chemotaxis protein
MSGCRRILVLQADSRPASAVPAELANCELVYADSLAAALSLLRTQRFDALYAGTHDPAVLQRAAGLIEADRILQTLPDIIAVVDANLRVIWGNAAFESWCGRSVIGRDYFDALGSPEVLGPDSHPLSQALSGKTASTRLHCRDNRYLDLYVTPVREAGGCVGQLISLGRDVTAEVNQQQKLNALHQAGHELAPLSPDQLAEMSAEERIELLKLNIRRLTHDLLHYHVIELRLLDRRTGKLEPLMQEGMTEAAAKRALFAQADGNGVTGLVAATGNSYLCPDTSKDPHYIQGAPGARSSLTVPLVSQDGIIGTFNVESTEPNSFTKADQQFLEMFSREIAAALHTLELLSAEKQSTASKSVEAVSREVAMPLDEILTAATAILDRYIGLEPSMADKLRHILASARAMRQCIQRVGEDLAPGLAASRQGEGAHPRLRGMRVLLADNDDRVRRSAHAILGRWGCVVETAGDGQEALTMARLSNYDVILADIRLPDVSGHDIYHRLRQVQPEARIVLMSAYGYDPSHAIVKARQEGLRFVLYKPFRIDQLLEALEKPDAPPAPAPPSSQHAPLKA